MEKKRPGNLQGKRAEDYAAKLLADSGYTVIDKNFRSKFGGIDLNNQKMRIDVATVEIAGGRVTFCKNNKCRLA